MWETGGGDESMNHTLGCHCGKLRGELDSSAPINRGICYYKDCQAFTFALGEEASVLDAQGGTDILQTMPSAFDSRPAKNTWVVCG